MLSLNILDLSIVKKFLAVFSSFLTLFVFSILPVSAQTIEPHGPIIRNKNGTSLNWSGYVATGKNVTDVRGSWIVPVVDCTVTPNAYSSAWVGIDGYNSSSVEQIGTEHDCINGQAQYYAWYEMYPKPMYKIPVNIAAGQNVTAEVNYLGNGSFQLTLNGYSLIQKSGKARRTSAEWIMEAPWSGGVLPLADFQVAYFTNSQATINGKTNTINAFPYDQINMANSSGALKDQASTLSSDGSSFNVTWISSK